VAGQEITLLLLVKTVDLAEGEAKVLLAVQVIHRLRHLPLIQMQPKEITVALHHLLAVAVLVALEPLVAQVEPQQVMAVLDLLHQLQVHQ
jgi:hypothetical protein